MGFGERVGLGLGHSWEEGVNWGLEELGVGLRVWVGLGGKGGGGDWNMAVWGGAGVGRKGGRGPGAPSRRGW